MNARSMLFLGFSLLAAPAGVQAAPLDLIISGSCWLDCGNIGLVDGAAIGGRVQVDDAFFSPDGQSGNEALRSYSFSFGDFSFSSSTAPDPGFSISWGSSARSVFLLGIDSFASSNPAAPGLALTIGAAGEFVGNGTATHDGWQRVIPDCCIETNYGNAAYLSTDPIEIAPVPLPPAAGLIAAGLAALAACGRLGRRRRAAAA